MSEVTERDVIEEVQNNPDGPRRIAQALNAQLNPEQIDAAVRHRARGLLEKDRFDRHFPDIVEDPDQYAAAVRLDAEMYRRDPDMSERDRFAAVGEAIRRGFGSDVDHALAIAGEQRRRRRAQQQAGEDEASHKPTAADIAIQESEAEYQANIGEAMTQIVRARGPQILPPRSDAQKLAAERRELEKRRRAQGW
jgi:hypothetical protein